LLSRLDHQVHVPLLLRVPWKAATSAGRHTASFTELLDLYRRRVARGAWRMPQRLALRHHRVLAHDGAAISSHLSPP
jgi:hypothetical protein